MVEKYEFEPMIIRYLKGEATPEEAMILEDWKAESTENRKLFQQYERLINGDRIFQSPDIDLAWRTVQKKSTSIVIQFRKAIAWTSAIAALIVVGMLIFNQRENSAGTALKGLASDYESTTPQFLFAQTEAQAFTLSDQSQVALTKGSSLKLSKNFGKGERRSQLIGSGRFSVIHDDSNPFIVEVNGLEVHDIGTVFDIQSKEDTVKVVVYEGSVELRRNNEIIALAAGDSAFYVISEQLMQTYQSEKVREDVIFKFDGTTLTEVASILNSFYSKNITIMSEELKTCKITIVFKNKSLAEILEYIKLTLDLNIVYKPSKIEIYGEGC